MLKNLKRILGVPTTAEMELAYLNSAGDRYELEYREREVSRGRFRQRGRSCGF